MRSDLHNIRQGEMRTISENIKYIVECDSRTLWINSHAAGLVGRFSPMGNDVHADGTCLDCNTRRSSFDNFEKLMMKNHKIDVSPYRSELPWLKVDAS